MNLKDLLCSIFHAPSRDESSNAVMANLTAPSAIWVDHKTGVVYRQVGDCTEEVLDKSQQKAIKDYLDWEESSVLSLFN